MNATTRPSAVFEQWLGHPVVDYARKRAPSASALDVLETLSGMLNELEDRFPGVPFADILDRRAYIDTEGRRHEELTIARRLVELGVAPEDVRAMHGDRAGLAADAAWTEVEFAAAEQGWSTEEMRCAYGWSAWKATQVAALAVEPDRVGVAIGDAFEAGEHNHTHLMQRFGVSRNKVKQDIRRRRYRIWKAAR